MGSERSPINSLLNNKHQQNDERYHSTKELKHRKCMMCCVSAVDCMWGAMGARLKSRKLLKFNQGENRLIILLFTSLFLWARWRAGAHRNIQENKKMTQKKNHHQHLDAPKDISSLTTSLSVFLTTFSCKQQHKSTQHGFKPRQHVIVPRKSWPQGKNRHRPLAEHIPEI